MIGGAAKEPRKPQQNKRCIDCKAEFEKLHAEWVQDTVAQQHLPEPVMRLRDCPHPGPRCYTHHHAKTKERKAKAHDQRVQKVYGLGPGEYEVLLAFQGGKCALCRRATGATKKLAVDHDHSTGNPRGLLCGPCNQMLGHGRDSIEFFERVLTYLAAPPYALLKVLESQKQWGELVTWGDKILRVHKAADCLGPCAIHSPSEHHMRTWPLLYRPDRNMIERVCVHGIGHPDPDQISFWSKTLEAEDAAAEAVHGCDFCCREGDRSE